MNSYPESRKAQELKYLQEKGILLDTDLASDIRSDLHLSKIWAKVFWRRRKRHKDRVDPEVPLALEQHPASVLEIGAGYGRVLQKIAQRNQKTGGKIENLLGIEICPYFEPFAEAYKEASSFSNYSIIFDDFFSTESLFPGSFDLILLPMNTLPNFSISLMPVLFQKVKQLLRPSGTWIFSTYKISDFESLQHSFKEKYSGELLVELREDIIVGEFFSFAPKKMNHGYRITNYSIYNTLSRKYDLKTREIFRTLQELIDPAFLHPFIEEQGFDIDFIDDSSHSRVYALSPKPSL